MEVRRSSGEVQLEEGRKVQESGEEWRGVWDREEVRLQQW